MSGALAETTLTRQLFNTILVIALALAFVFGTVQIAADLRSERNSVDESIERIVRTSINSAAQAVYTLDSVLGEQIALGIAQDPLIRTVYLRDEFGSDFARAGPIVSSSTLDFVTRHLFERQQTYQESLIQPQGERTVGQLAIATDLSKVTSAFVTRSTLTIVSGAIRNLLLGLALFWLLRRNLTGPLRGLARLISAGTPAVDIPPGHEHDEIGSIVRAYNSALREQLAAEQAARRLQKSEAIERLAAGVAHDFNNVLTVASGNLSLLRLMVDEQKYAERFDEAEQALTRAGDLTRQLLHFSRGPEPDGSSADINKLIKGIENLLWRSLGPQAELKLDPLWRCDVDAGEFQDSLVNLTINAGHAMTDRRLLTIVTANADIPSNANAPHPGPGQYVRLEVIDTGSGIPDAIREYIFDPFFSTKPQEQGSGLGLSMVAGFARRHRAHVDVESTMGTGTTFRFYFPRSQTSPDAIDPARMEQTINGDSESRAL
ncbi:MAG: ATP-binding protein [Pseudomonadota bacterium]